MVQIDDDKIRGIGKLLNDPNRPLKERFRALFTLKNLGGAEAIQQISQCFGDQSALLKHELAYCLGQMQDPTAVPYLTKVLEDKTQEPMVRHEAGAYVCHLFLISFQIMNILYISGEALGAIGHPDVIPILEKYVKDPTIEVAETCEIALGRLNWLLNNKEKEKTRDENPYASVDPSPPAAVKDVPQLTAILLDENEKLYERYRAMFSLRNLRTVDSINALGKGLKCNSALFRHEVAFVLGQLQHECSIGVLAENLKDTNENEMVRHECAEALGAIATDECIEILNRYLDDEKQVVKESCIVALDMCEYENSPEFQYANALTTATAIDSSTS